MWVCAVLHEPAEQGGNLHLCQLSHVYTQKQNQKKKIRERGKDMILFAFHHNILSPYGQPSSWHGATVKCVPPQQPTHIPPLIIISKSRAAYALNIRLLCVVINPITHMDKCTAHRSAGTGAYMIFTSK